MTIKIFALADPNIGRIFSYCHLVYNKIEAEYVVEALLREVEKGWGRK